LLGGLLAAITLTGCAKEAAGDAAPAQAGTAAKTETAPAKGDACGLLTLTEVRGVVPQASRVERNDNLTKYGIAACSWYGTGKAPVVDVSVWDVSGADDTAESNLQTLAMGVADPTRPGAQAAVRIEKVAGIENAFVIVEKADGARGILSNGALLSVQKNGRIATVASAYVDFDDRPKAMDQLATLGKAIAARL